MDLGRNMLRLESLPVEILHHIIEYLPFNVIITLLQTGNRNVIGHIQSSFSYMPVFAGIEKAKDLKVVGDIIAFYYEISTYRSQKSPAWKMLYKGTPLPSRTPRQHSSKIPSAEIYYDQDPTKRMAMMDRLNTSSRAEWKHFLQKLSLKIRKIEGGIKLRHSFSQPALNLLEGIKERLTKPELKDLLTVNRSVSEGVDIFVASLQDLQVDTVKQLMKPFPEFLKQHESIVLLSPRRTGSPQCTVKLSSVEDIFLQEILDHMIRPVIVSYAVEQLENRMHNLMQAAPDTTYSFFNDYFNNNDVVRQSRFSNIRLGEKERIPRYEGAFWWARFQETFPLTGAGQQIHMLADILEQHPYISGRSNFALVKQNMVSMAKMVTSFHLLKSRRPDQGLQYLQRDQRPHYSFRARSCFFIFFAMLDKHPLDLRSLINDAQMADFSTADFPTIQNLMMAQMWALDGLLEERGLSFARVKRKFFATSPVADKAIRSLILCLSGIASMFGSDLMLPSDEALVLYESESRRHPFKSSAEAKIREAMGISDDVETQEALELPNNFEILEGFEIIDNFEISKDFEVSEEDLKPFTPRQYDWLLAFIECCRLFKGCTLYASG